MAVDIGTGTTIGFGTTAYAAEITEVSGDGAEVPVIPVPHMGTTGSVPKITGDLLDEGTIGVSIHFDPDLMNTIPFKTSQTITITFPVPSGQSNGATAAGTGALTAHTWTGPLEDKMVGNYTLTWLAAVTWTDSS